MLLLALSVKLNLNHYDTSNSNKLAYSNYKILLDSLESYLGQHDHPAFHVMAITDSTLLPSPLNNIHIPKGVLVNIRATGCNDLTPNSLMAQPRFDYFTRQTPKTSAGANENKNKKKTPVAVKQKGAAKQITATPPPTPTSEQTPTPTPVAIETETMSEIPPNLVTPPPQLTGAKEKPAVKNTCDSYAFINVTHEEGDVIYSAIITNTKTYEFVPHL